MAGPMLRDAPTFDAKSSLVRYIHPDFRRPSSNRIKTGAFQKGDGESHLSVNSLEVETLKQVAQIYAAQFENGQRPVAISSPKVEQYNEAATAVGLKITYNENTKSWEFSGALEAYKHREKINNKSHCGVEYVRSFSEQQDFNFAVRMVRVATRKDV